MSLNKRDIFLLIAVIGIVVVFFKINAPEKELNTGEIIASPEMIETTTTPNPTPTPPPNTSRPQSELIIDTKDYEYWFDQLDSKNQVLGIYDECGYIVPSNVDHKNNVTIMLDNTRSEKGHVLKIGPNEYPLKAGEWKVTTLRSSQVPAKWQIFCEGVELGQIDLR